MSALSSAAKTPLMPEGDDQVIVEPPVPSARDRRPWARGPRPRASARLRILASFDSPS